MSCKNRCDKDGCHSGNPSALCCSVKAELLKGLEGWEILPEAACIDMVRLNKHFEFKNFVDALEFVNKIGDIAEKMNHHPNIHLEWGKVRVEIWTHAINDLTELDFILAREIDYIK